LDNVVITYLREHWQYLTRPNAYLNVDVLRAFAVLMVMIAHWRDFCRPLSTGAVSTLMQIGSMGVDLFFVLSGFLIGGMLIEELRTTNKLSLETFYRRRFLRIYPLYFFVTVISIFAGFFLGRATIFELPHVAKIFFLDVFFLHTAVLKSPNMLQAIGSWTLAIEEWFYLLMPLTLFSLFRITKGNRLALGGCVGLLICAAIIIRAVCLSQLPSTVSDMRVWIESSRPWMRFDELLLGTMTYIFGISFVPVSRKVLLAAGGLMLAAVFAYNAGILHFPAKDAFALSLLLPTWICIGFGLIVAGSLYVRFQHPILTVIARLSYSLYLMHSFSTLAFPDCMHHDTWIFMTVMSFGFAYLVSAFIEYPFIRFYKQRRPAISITILPADVPVLPTAKAVQSNAVSNG
jgi:peptidoglycan/LPS O-acetylase OafA/YrhL